MLKPLRINKHIVLFLLVFSSCFLSDYQSEMMASPSGKFKVQATVNRTERSADDYAEVVIHLIDSMDNKMVEINTGAGDANKWALGWTVEGDTIVLQSSDIGNQAWIIRDKRLFKVSMNNTLNERAEALKEG